MAAPKDEKKMAASTEKKCAEFDVRLSTSERVKELLENRAISISNVANARERAQNNESLPIPFLRLSSSNNLRVDMGVGVVGWLVAVGGAVGRAGAGGLGTQDEDIFLIKGRLVFPLPSCSDPSSPVLAARLFF